MSEAKLVDGEPTDSMSEFQKVKAAYERLFRTANGKIVLADLKQHYSEGELVVKGEAPEQTVARAAKHDLVQVISRMSKTEKK
jgi:hypothetical protein